MRAPQYAALLCGLVMAGSCEGTTPPGAIGRPAALIILEGQDLTGVVGKQLTTALSVQVVDSANNPVPGQIVNFHVTFGGGSVFAGAAVTSSEGIAKERWTLGTVAADSQRLEARAVDVVTGDPLVFATFRATALADVAASVIKVSGDQQAVTAGGAASDSLVVRVVDQYQNPVSGAAVSWTPGAQSGSVSPSTSTTDAAGLAATRWTVGANGSISQQVSATTGSLNGVTFGATVLGAAATQIVVGTPAAGAQASVPFTTQPAIRLADANGNTDATATQPVTVSVSSGGTLIGTTTVSAVQGIATFTNVGIAGMPATYTLTYSALVGGSTKTTTQVIAVSSGPLAAYRVTTASNSAAVGSSFTAEAQVVDASGNDIATEGRIVQWLRAKANGVFSVDTTRTNAQGRASVTFTLDTFLGDTTVVITASDWAVAGVNGSKTLSVTSGPAAKMIFNTQPDARGWGLLLNPTIVTVQDQYNNRVLTDTRTITVSLASGPATLSGTTSKAAVQGIATFNDLFLDNTGNGFTLSASDGGGTLTTITSNSFNSPLPGQFSGLSSGKVDLALDGSTLYYVTGGSGTPAQLWSTPTVGGSNQLVASLGTADPRLVQVNGGFVDVLQRASATSSFITRIPIGGGSPVQLSVDPTGQTCDAGFEMAFDGTYFIVACLNGESLVRVNATDGSRLTLATTAGSFALSGGFVYYRSGTTIKKVPMDASAAPTTLVTGLPSTGNRRTLITTATTLYWIESTGLSVSATVRSAPLSGGASTLVAGSFWHDAKNLTLDSGRLWFVSRDGGVQRVLLSDNSVSALGYGCCATNWFVLGPNAAYLLGTVNIFKGPKN